MDQLKKVLLISLLGLWITSCSYIEPKPFEPSAAHIKKEQELPKTDIPELVEQAPILPEPRPAPDLEKYTVVVNEVPVKELLFALARDAGINVDIAPDIEGVVTINAVEQTLPQILSRIARQVEMRYEFEDQNLYISKDKPFLRNYTIDYVNMSRKSESSNTVATQIQSTSSDSGVTGGAGGGGSSSSGGSGGGNNNSTTGVNSLSRHDFWRTLVTNISSILGIKTQSSGESLPVNTSVIANPEAGMLTVRATKAQHEEIQEFITQTQHNVQRQVLIKVTIAEIQLSDQYQAGVDWDYLAEAGKAGFDIVSTTLTGVPVGTLSSFVLEYNDPNTDRNRLNATISLLDEFGDVRIMSSPQLMVLNNQTALLKVVENIVYFEVDVEPGVVSLAGVTDPAIDTTAATVPVGIVMAVTPQIAASEMVSLNVRPTISRVTDFKNDPNPELANAGVENPVPQIEVRELESMLRLSNGQIGVLGGLMQDSRNDRVDGLPGFKDISLFGNAFKTKTKQYTKTELVIFIQPFVIKNPSLDGDLDLYRPYLDYNTGVPDYPESGGS